MNAPDEAIATHESAHVCLSVRAGCNVQHVELIDDRGRVVIGSGEVDAHDHIIALLSGGIAEKRLTGNDSNGNGIDEAEAWHLALKVSEGRETEAKALLDLLRLKAESRVDQHWRQINKLAYALMDKGKLTGEEVSKILNASLTAHELPDNAAQVLQ